MKKILDFTLLVYMLSIYFFTYQTNLNVVSNIIAIVFVGLVLIKTMMEKKHIRWSFFLSLFLMFIVVCGFSYFVALVKEDVISKVMTLLQIFILVFAMIQYVDSREDILRIFKYFVVAGFGASVYLLMHSDIAKVNRIGSALANENTAGIIISYSFFMALYFALTTKKTFYVIASCVMLLTILLTGSRITFFYVLTCYLIYSFLNSRGSMANKIRSIALLIFGGVLLYFLFKNVPVLYDIVGKRLENIFNFFTGRGEVNEQSLVIRNYMFWYGLEMFKLKPILGYGAGDSYVLLQASEQYKFGYFHSNYIEILVSVGLIGFVVYYIMILGVIVQLLKRSYSQLNNVLIAVISGMLVMHFQAVQYYNKHDYIVLALASIVYLFHNEAEEKSRALQE